LPEPSRRGPSPEQAAGRAPAGPAIPAEPASPVATRVEVEVFDARFELRHGHASFEDDTLTLRLTGEPVACSARPELVGRPPAMGATLTVRIASGPGGHFFAGHAVGFNMTFEPARTGAGSSSPELLSSEGLWAPVVALALQPSTWNAGDRVRGTIEGDQDRIGGTAIRGAFDVELCNDAHDRRPLPVTAPATPVRGNLGDTPLVPRTVYALIQHHTAFHRTHPGAVQHVRHGGIPEIGFLVFYAQPNVPCPKVSEVLAQPPMIYLRNLGGTSAERMLGGPQPADAVVTHGDRDVGWPAWFQLDSFTYTAGAKLTGSLWAGSSVPGGQGQFAGRFEAIVCDAGLDL
jgi:hypothetical protein